MANLVFPDAGAPTFDDPLEMLSACHGRMERQLATLARLQRWLPQHGCDGEARTAARAILRYFDLAAPNHHADEEQSVFPRLLAASPSAKALLGDLERDHAALANGWVRLRPLLAGIAVGARANLSARDVVAMRRAYESHIAREDGDLIPLAATTFDAATLAAIGREMAERRAVK